MERMNKKGQEMTLSTIIVIVLGIAVLIFLIFGFSTGWGNLWDRITNLGGGRVNVDTVKQACALACSTNAEYDFCTRARKVVIEEGYQADTTCEKLEGSVEFMKKGQQNKSVDIGLDSCSISCPIVSE